jgi:hypothetical protein
MGKDTMFSYGWVEKISPSPLEDGVAFPAVDIKLKIMVVSTSPIHTITHEELAAVDLGLDSIATRFISNTECFLRRVSNNPDSVSPNNTTSARTSFTQFILKLNTRPHSNYSRTLVKSRPILAPLEITSPTT